MKRVCFLLAALFFAWNPAFTQSSGVIFAPFVSRLSAEVNGRQVRLSWMDSGSVNGPVYIYRSTQPYLNNDAANMAQSFTAVVPYGVQTYADHVPSDGKWYYFIAASDNTQQKYTLLIPFSNTIDVSAGGAQNSAAAGNPAGNNEYAPVFYNFYGSQFMAEPYQSPYTRNSAETSTNTNTNWPPYSIVEGLINPPARANITGITAVSSGRGIDITFNAADPSKNAVLYRSIQPIRSFSDLLTATVVALGAKSPYTDRITPGVPYYYAVVYEDDIRAGQSDVFPGSNATFIPAEVPLNQQPAETAGLSSAYSSQTAAGGYTPYRQIQPSNDTAVAPAWSSGGQPSGGYVNNDLSGVYDNGSNMYGRQNPNAVNTYPTARPYLNQTDETLILSEPRVFNRDMQTTGDPVDRQLSLIVQGPFMWRDWPVARARLTEFIMDTSNSAAAERARFYLAQCWYFIGDIRMALSSFLKLQQVFPEETSIWIQASLNRIADR